MSWQNAFMSDYERIATVIRYLDAHHTEQPDLATLASYVGLSPSHFHRLFSAWAGVTPKDFLQCLTLAHARTLLHSGENVLNTALNSGLSGPGRLHDLCINLESASPGEMKSGGAGWTITFGFADTPFGACLVGENTRGICHLSFVDTRDEGALNRLNRDWPRAQFRRNDAAAAQLVHRVFDSSVGIQHKLPLRAFVKGTPFQVRVWRALLQVQPGQLVTYGSLAAAIGRPAAARAVGTAVGQNSLAYLIPCHRVIRETGAIGGYRWGPVRKRAIQAWESSRATRADTGSPADSLIS